MYYPINFENKTAFDEIREGIKNKCISPLGKEWVDLIKMSDDHKKINDEISQIIEYKRILGDNTDPIPPFYDLRHVLSQLHIEGTYLEEKELAQLLISLQAIKKTHDFLNLSIINEHQDHTQTEDFIYPKLQQLTVGIITFPDIISMITRILDDNGKIKENATPELKEIKTELRKAENSVNAIIQRILKQGQNDGLLSKDTQPTIRDGRLVIPIHPGIKRQFKGIIHDESATGKTVYVEPETVVQVNNKIRELQIQEKKEIIKILKQVAEYFRPFLSEIIASFKLMGRLDFVQAKTLFANYIGATPIHVCSRPVLTWHRAIHPLLKFALQRHNKQVVPLDITLTPQKHILLISGPNAGGKSVCLKVVGLLQYMIQCGIPIPVDERSEIGVFKHIMIDIGDEQSIENELSTYSSHLTNMKYMLKNADQNSLILIDEFGSGTEPLIGGAIAQTILRRLCLKQTFGVITTHFQNLKQFAESQPGIVNGAMMYDRQQMKPLFKLNIGQPGSSFAIEIARSIGLPQEIINEVKNVVGNEYIQSDKYLQDIIRDKKYWLSKREKIKQQEKNMSETLLKYEEEIKKINQNKNLIISEAKKQAEQIINDSNKIIENVIKDIKESQAEKQKTKSLRDKLNVYKEEIQNIEETEKDLRIMRKMGSIKSRKSRHLEFLKNNNVSKNTASKTVDKKESDDFTVFHIGDTVEIKSLQFIGTITHIQGDKATVVSGSIKTQAELSQLALSQKQNIKSSQPTNLIPKDTRETIENKKNSFKTDLDVRGFRGEEAINAVMFFVDDAVLLGMSRIRVLHGTGNGILRQLIRQFLATQPYVRSYRDEHVQFGGAGITVIDLA